MVRTIIGGLVGGFVLYLIGFLFWGTPLSALAFTGLDDARSTTLQAALAQNLTQSGTGTYIVPNPATQQGTTLFGQGPVATVHFNVHGFPVVDSAALVAGLVLALVTGLLIAFAMRLGERQTVFGDRARIAILYALAITLYLDLGQPIFNHYGWGHFVYVFLGDFIGLAAAGLIVARWFGPKDAVVAPATTSDPAVSESRPLR